ncbi:hypothetical protein C4561_04650 [candidate division WWE3 bacterium]|uniref:Preprotein translocase subunit SecA n=1 Tax=candidate division WWE3 bacterium TaxID=2053526 RepID=A0A3A4ZC14_UNCKA|nr:MAG: hypothetical protein C4561_04650 [candidate division WWE3 bacterium]
MEVNYPETVIEKSGGLTPAEKHLSRLCSETFLSLWSYPNIYRDQGRTSAKRSEAKGDGKELCDLLVVFENHVIIFSDKRCEYPNTGDAELDWSRWYRRAVHGAAEQIWGAERWIFKYPNTIYLDKRCKQPFPLAIPPKEQAIVHRIVVAHGVVKKCIEFFDGGTGSLMIWPRLVGDLHIRTREHQCTPFAIGQVNPAKGYVHVFDDTSLQIVMRTVDTIFDFVQYLTKKEQFILSGKLFMASGEDDLLGYYLQNSDEAGEHTFFPKPEKEINAICIDEGIWEEFARHPSRLAQIKANEISYSWDRLIEKFTFHVTTGTSYKLSHPSIQSQEIIFRFLAKENRTRRRFLANSIHELIAKTPNNYRATRIILPSKPGDPYYLFLLLPRYGGTPVKDYRELRGDLLERYLRVLKLKYPAATDIIGIATETGFSTDERSEDIAYLDATEWTEQENAEAQDIERELVSLGALSKRTLFRTTTKEYPDPKTSKVRIGMKGTERNIPCPCGSGKKFKKCCGGHSKGQTG